MTRNGVHLAYCIAGSSWIGMGVKPNVCFEFGCRAMMGWVCRAMNTYCTTRVLNSTYVLVLVYQVGAQYVRTIHESRIQYCAVYCSGSTTSNTTDCDCEHKFL